VWINLLYVSAIIIAIGFLILVIYVSKTLSAVQHTLIQLSGTVSDLEKQIADDIQKKSESLNTVVIAVKDMGETVQRVNNTFKNISNSVTEKAEINSEKVSQIIQWGNTAIDLWDKWKQKKQSKIINQVEEK
jgi:uncharacterized protein YoxC